MELKELFQAWQLTSSLHSFNPPASEQSLLSVESELGFRIPQPLRELYLFSNGMHLFHGDLNLYPLQNGNNTLSNASRQCSEWFKIPPDLLIFGDNGSDEHYGIWATKVNNEIFGFPIIEIGELYHDPACMVIVSTDLLPFLYGVTAFFTLLSDNNGEALDIIGFPINLRVDKNEVNDEYFARIRKWIDPMSPDLNPEPYTKGLNTYQVKSLFR